MQSNTAAVGIQDVNFASFSAEHRKCDPFAVIDGHYVGHDGFVVPKNFDVFYERFPQHVRNWLARRVGRSTPKQDIEDWTQDLLIHLNCLPANSKHRAAGKEDVVQTFDPRKQFGASSARFFNYVNLCLANRFMTIRSARMRDAICRTGNISFAESSDEGDSGRADDEFCHEHSRHLRERRERQQKQQDARHALAEFADFVKHEDSSLLRAMGAIASTATSGGAAEFLGTTEADFYRMRSRLRQLGRCFHIGKQVPRQRRRYKRRLIAPISVAVR